MERNSIERFDSQAFLASVNAGRSVEKYAPGQPVFRQGDDADAVYYIRDGKVRVTVVSEQGKEGVIGIMESGDFLGEGCLNGHHPRMATASALEESEILKIEKSAMVRVLHEQPSFSELFMEFMLSRNGAIEEDLVDQLFNSSEKQLARVLLQLSNFGKDGKMEPVVAHISQDMLAAKVGTTRSRISFFMNKFRKLGLIEYSSGSNGGLKVHSSLLDVIVKD
jgi:CRP-like cAMP-binding protein